MLEFDLDRLRELRARRPDAIAEAAAARRRRPALPADGRLLLVAADHTARGILGVSHRPLAMADRGELLRRLVTALGRPGVDGVLGTADVIDDLLLLGALDGKVVIGSMNRGGLQGASFEVDDRFTGYTAPVIAAMGFEGGKMLCRIDPEDPATVATLTACADAVSALAARRLLALVEPFLSRRVDGQLDNDLRTDAVVRAVTVASGLGSSSARTWLKLPVVEDMERVAAATTLPLLMLGGDPAQAPERIYAGWEKALALPGVRGLVVGRALLFPPDDDVAAAVDVAAALTHPGAA